MSAQPVDVRAVMTQAVECLRAEFDSDCGMDSALAAVAELVEASARTVRAFEALGRASGVVPNLEAHRECEAALVAQKAALARAQGPAVELNPAVHGLPAQGLQ